MPLLANQLKNFQNQLPKASLAVVMASFVGKKRKQIISLFVTTIFGTTLLACGLAFLILITAQSADFHGVYQFKISTYVSIIIFLIGAGLDLYVWKKFRDIEKEFVAMVGSHFAANSDSGQPRSVFRSILSSVLHSMAGNAMSNRNM